MDKQWMQWCALALALAGGCGEETGAMPWMDPDPNDGVAGSVGEAVAGSGGSAGDVGAPVAGVGGVGGTAGAGGSAACVPHDPDPIDPPTMDGGIVDPIDATPDAGTTEDPMLADNDAGVEAMPDAGGNDPSDEPDVVEPAPPRAPNTGEIVVSEVMMDPTALSDSLGEWIELHNATQSVLTLEGCVISDDRNDDFVLEALALPANGYLVLGRSEQAAPRVDHVYSGMTLTNTGDEIVITCNGVTVDRVAYAAGYPRPAGHPMQLDATTLTAAANDLPDAWCAAVDAGTPGAANAACADE